MSTCTSLLPRILALPTKFFVDIGASNSPEHSQTEALLEHGWSGIMFECNSEKYPDLMKRMENHPVTVIPEKVTPENILDHLRSANVPSDFYLSIDIDGQDYFVLKSILSEYRPQLIVSEINEKIPPPLKFTVLQDPNYWWDTSHFTGQSISMLEDLLPLQGYKVDSLDYNNAILVPGVQEKSIKQIQQEGYVNKPDRRAIFQYNYDFDPILNASPSDAYRFVENAFRRQKGRQSLTMSEPIQPRRLPSWMM